MRKSFSENIKSSGYTFKFRLPILAAYKHRGIIPIVEMEHPCSLGMHIPGMSRAVQFQQGVHNPVHVELSSLDRRAYIILINNHR